MKTYRAYPSDTRRPVPHLCAVLLAPEDYERCRHVVDADWLGYGCKLCGGPLEQNADSSDPTNSFVYCTNRSCAGNKPPHMNDWSSLGNEPGYYFTSTPQSTETV